MQLLPSSEDCNLKLFPIKIAICNSIGYLVSVGVPIFCDPLIEHNYTFGPRVYPIGYSVFLGAIPIFLISLFFDICNIKKETKSILICLSLVIPTWLTLSYFKPEFPHLWVLLVPIIFSLYISISVYIHDYEIRYDDFISLESISEKVKIEKIKLDYETWFRLFLAILTGYAVMAITYLTKLTDWVKMFTPIEKEQFMIQYFYSLAIFISAIIFIITVCIEMIKKITETKDKLACIPKDIPNGDIEQKNDKVP